MVSSRRLAFSVLASAVFALLIGASGARPARSAPVTINMLISGTGMPGWQVLISNFERVYPNITVNAMYLQSNLLPQFETVELAAGNAPDLVAATPGCGTLISVCEIAKDGYLSPLVKEPWTKRALRLVTSADKYGQGLFAFTPAVDPDGMFTNDDLFKKLGLTIPQTFAQLITVCEKAKAVGTPAIDLPTTPLVSLDLAVNAVYAKDKKWPAELRAGKATFDGTPGWHQALQEYTDMSNAGCFPPGAPTANPISDFERGQGLMLPNLSSVKGLLDTGSAQFSYSFHKFPAGTSPNQTWTYVNLANSVSINAHTSAANQMAAREFIDFIARPKQNALYTQIIGGLTQYEALKQQIPAFMSDLGPMLDDHAYVINPSQTWWNPGVLLALQQDEVGLITGQESIDDVLNAMDAAWKQGPS